MNTKQYYKVGDYIGLSEGVYSDYSFTNLVKVVKDFNMKEVAEEFISGGMDKYGYCNNEDKDFYEYLIENGLVETVEYEEVWLGDYSFELQNSFKE